ncbi:MAG: hypothetical protein ACE5KU_03720 [Nitrososphaerales archaeon]
MAEDFADKVSRLAPKDDFVKVARQSLNEVLGESAASAVIYHLGVKESEDPKVFEERLRAIFGIGADTILKRILEKLRISSEGEEAD